MAKSVGVITMYRKNYGAFLQAYALQKTLIKLGYTAELIRYDHYREKSLLGIPFGQMRQPVLFAKKLAIEILRYKQHREWDGVFDKSIKKYLKESEMYYRTYGELEKHPPEYDIYLTGSDQVFNAELTPHALKSRLLCFAGAGVRVSYAASAGNGRILTSVLPLFQSELAKFQQVSVREEELKYNLKQQLNLRAEQNIDPTLLLTEKEWQSFGEKESVPSEPYIFYYRVLYQKELQEETEKLSKQLNLAVFSANGKEQFQNQMTRTETLSPEKWVEMLNAAAYVVTNSFHGIAFSIIFKKRVFATMPPNGGTRIADILSKCSLKRLLDCRLIEEAETAQLYAEAEHYISQERQRAFAYLTSMGL